jgi:branched-chain amino acid aminotransferase
MWDGFDVVLEKMTPEARKDLPPEDQLGFGKHFTDHMFVMAWSQEDGWHDARICPYGDFQMDPAAMVFHYGQAIFEGLKAYRGKDDQIFLFRPEENFKRMNQSAVRMCMPRFPEEKVLQALKALLYLEKRWIPSTQGASLYIRPTMIASQPALGVAPANRYLFYIILSPVGAYYREGFGPTKIYVSDEYVRAVKGGVGGAKTAGNYAASLFMSQLAKKAGYTQVLWLDACDHKYIEEVGTSNIFMVLDDQLVTPPLDGSILAGITRDSVMTMARDWGIEVVERKLTIEEVLNANVDGRLREIFGTGTAAVVSPVGELYYQEKSHQIADGLAGPLASRLFKELQALQYGHLEDSHNWLVKVG